ncbi:type VI secretion system accessory protein TagJ [Phytobacter sp. V91]|uniref:type VI secretion system accessory protein TagJ n=1 Tax=Phytobacter sp. V91 TaxID=3369425 RepID=UPI003F6390A2
MNTLDAQLAGDSLKASLGSLENQIRTQPTNADLRAAFTQLLCLDGNWSRALAQLKGWLALTPQAQPTITLLEQAISGEKQRAEVMAGRARPVMPARQWPWLAAMVNALDLFGAQACTERIVALEQADAIPGELTLQDGTSHRFDWLMDGDCRFGPVCETLINGRYCWLPFSAIAEMTFQAPVSVTDLIWRHTLIRLHDGSEQVCQIPVRYPFEAGTEDRFLLSRTTEWQPLPGEDPHYMGQGQKVWLNDSAEYPLLTLATLRFTEVKTHE